MIVLQYGFPAALLIFSFWFPESAYYLLKKGKVEEARKALLTTYGSGNQDLIECEMKRIAENVRFSEELATAAAAHGPLLLQCFTGTNLVWDPWNSNSSDGR